MAQKILSSEQIRMVDKYTIENKPIKSIDLMERAGTACFDWILSNFSYNSNFYIFIGPGNNGGDGLVIARIMAIMKIKVKVIYFSEKMSNDSEMNFKNLTKEFPIETIFIEKITDIPPIESHSVIIDALFGSGLTKPLMGFAAEIVHFINNSHSTVISIDIPSGLFSENNSSLIFGDTKFIVRANYTLTFQLYFLALLLPENEIYCGEVHVLPIGLDENYINSLFCNYTYIEDIDILLKKRNKFAHKGCFGHGLLIAGSLGKIGACVLSAKAALRTGIGLLSVHIPKSGGNVLQTAVPEAMLSFDKSNEIFSSIPSLQQYSAIGIGPGIGTDSGTKAALIDILKTHSVPIVLDADALNILSTIPNFCELLKENTILTPHVKEFERLFGKTTDDYNRLLLQREMSIKHKIIIVLKGAHTITSCPDGFCYFNSTGNPGMATAGSGDVLTGIILSLLSQGYSEKESAIFGVWLHGKAGDYAKIASGEHALIASDIVDNISSAYKYCIR